MLRLSRLGSWGRHQTRQGSKWAAKNGRKEERPDVSGVDLPLALDAGRSRARYDIVNYFKGIEPFLKPGYSADCAGSGKFLQSFRPPRAASPAEIAKLHLSASGVTRVVAMTMRTTVE